MGLPMSVPVGGVLCMLGVMAVEPCWRCRTGKILRRLRSDAKAVPNNSGTKSAEPAAPASTNPARTKPPSTYAQTKNVPNPVQANKTFFPPTPTATYNRKPNSPNRPQTTVFPNFRSKQKI